MDDNIYIKDCGKYFTVINRNGVYENHAHVDSYRKAKKLKKYIEKINFKNLKDNDKLQYYNVNKGVINK